MGRACESGETMPWVTMALATRMGFVSSPLGSWESCPSLKNRQSRRAHPGPEALLSLIGKAECWLPVTGRILAGPIESLPS
jgi:hypothetical protein